jgi:hypothetical protein
MDLFDLFGETLMQWMSLIADLCVSWDGGA